MSILTVPFMVLDPSVKEIPWYGVVLIVALDILCLVMLFHLFFARIILDEEVGILALCVFGMRSIPLQDIKLVKRDEFVHTSRGGSSCRIDIQCIKNDKKTIQLDVPMFGRKTWLEYIDEELERLNRRIDEWYMEYRKANKKR